MQRGVRYVFGLPGEENLHVLEALKNLRFNLLLPVTNKARRLWQMSMGAWLELSEVCFLRDQVLLALTGVANWLDGARWWQLPDVDQMH